MLHHFFTKKNSKRIISIIGPLNLKKTYDNALSTFTSICIPNHCGAYIFK